ncbi:MAG TPA: hypothetical protein PLY81_05020 [Chitinophagaceae bacterium]|nr:hypothetical protein [Chitinophagaceae bacterium]HNE93673.1 hypothetical protein [Chitinophagaceae bacterium]HNF29620.1 hypothetical protein [Chitinophagaceae bacterium]
MDSTIDQQLSVLQNKLQLLLEKCHALKKENEQLKKQIEKNKQSQENSYKNLIALKTNNPEELEKRIDKYLQEIDRCLLLLNVEA